MKSGTGDTAWGVRAVIGGSYSDWFNESAGGVAYLNTFGSSTASQFLVAGSYDSVGLNQISAAM